MCKVIGSSIVVALVIASSSFAGLVEDQITTIGLNNAIDLLHGSQTASSLQNLVVDNEQCASGVCGGGPLQQSLFGSLGQVGNTWGNCALIGLTQDVDIMGLQSQQVGESCDPKAQVQSIGLGAVQTLAKADGAGGGDALHTIVLNSGQSANNAAGNLNEAQTIMGMQTSNITGEPGATGIVNSALCVTTNQTQGAL
jgi:hypothetical protein